MNSPQVQVIDSPAQFYVPNVTNEVASFVGHFERGPIDVPVLISSISEFKFIFGRGVGDFHNDWYQVYNYLQYSSSIWVTRSCGEVRINANGGSTESLITINKFSEWADVYSTLPDDPIKFIARTPGSWGNLLSIGVIGIDEYNSDVLVGYNRTAKTIFNFFESGHFGICVFRDGELVETFYKPLTALEELNAESIYLYIKANVNLFPTEIVQLSDFINSSGVLTLGGLGANDSRDSNGLISSSTLIQTIDLGSISDLPQTLDNYLFYGDSLIEFSNGSEMEPTLDDLSNSYDLFASTDTYDIDIIIGNERDNNLAVNLAETRRDCIAFIGFPTSLIEYLKLLMGNSGNPISAYTPNGFVIGMNEFKIPSRLSEVALTKMDEYIKTINESQFCHFIMNVKVQYDHFTGKDRLVNLAGDTSGLKSLASLRNPWSPGAGLERGVILNTKNMYMNLSRAHRARYYKMGLNYIENGAVVTQKTYLSSQTNYNRIYTRSLVNHIEKEIKYILRTILFTENTLRARQSVSTYIKRYLKEVRVNNGIENAKINIYPGSNNEVIVEITLKPKHVTEVVHIKMSNTGTLDIASVIK